MKNFLKPTKSILKIWALLVAIVIIIGVCLFQERSGLLQVTWLYDLLYNFQTYYEILVFAFPSEIFPRMFPSLSHMGFYIIPYFWAFTFIFDSIVLYVLAAAINYFRNKIKSKNLTT